MRLTKFERLLLVNQYLMLERLDLENADYYAGIRESLERGYESAYQEYLLFIHDGLPESECKFVVDVLSMHDALQRSYNEMGDETGIEELGGVGFPGFDGNNEFVYMSYARFVMDRQQRFTYLKLEGNDLNSHFPSLDRYRRMLDMWRSLDKSYELSRDGVTSILQAGLHPH